MPGPGDGRDGGGDLGLGEAVADALVLARAEGEEGSVGELRLTLVQSVDFNGPGRGVPKA